MKMTFFGPLFVSMFFPEVSFCGLQQKIVKSKYLWTRGGTCLIPVMRQCGEHGQVRGLCCWWWCLLVCLLFSCVVLCSTLNMKCFPMNCYHCCHGMLFPRVFVIHTTKKRRFLRTKTSRLKLAIVGSLVGPFGFVGSVPGLRFLHHKWDGAM